MYELVEGTPLFKGTNIEEMRPLLLRDSLQLKDYFSKNFTNLLEGLLNKRPQKRMTIDQIKNHPFFKDIVWEEV